MRMTTGLVLLVLLGFGAAPSRADSNCPLTYYFTRVDDRNLGNSTTGANGSFSDVSGRSTGQLSFDMAAGMFDVSSSAGTLGMAEIEPNDVYTISGLPPGTPVSFVARLHGAGHNLQQCTPTQCSSAGFQIKIWDIPGNEIFWSLGGSGSGSGSGDADLPLTRNAGEPFPLSMDVLAISQGSSQTFGSVSGEATLTFLGLPPGAIITSCKGYLLSPVSTNRDSWGALKIRYR
jgi:hypothetical protein